MKQLIFHIMWDILLTIISMIWVSIGCLLDSGLSIVRSRWRLNYQCMITLGSMEYLLVDFDYGMRCLGNEIIITEEVRNMNFVIVNLTIYYYYVSQFPIRIINSVTIYNMWLALSHLAKYRSKPLFNRYLAKWEINSNVSGKNASKYRVSSLCCDLPTVIACLG